jgi:hypothetical protein
MDSVNCGPRKDSKPSHFDAAPIFATPQSVFITPESGMSRIGNPGITGLASLKRGLFRWFRDQAFLACRYIIAPFRSCRFVHLNQ